jgi:SurA N-terminal domain
VSRIAILVPVVGAAVLLLAGCESQQTAATVNGAKITKQHVESVLDHAKDEAEREGKTFPEPGTAEHRALRNQALALLAYQEELRQRAGSLGITVDEDSVQALVEAGRGGEEGGKEDESFREAGIRSSLLYRRVYDRITRGVLVTPVQADHYYASHRDRYRAQGSTLAEARPQIERDLVTTAKNARMAGWVTTMKREFEPKIVYADGFGPGS